MHRWFCSRVAHSIEEKKNAADLRVQEESNHLNEPCHCLTPLKVAGEHFANGHMRQLAACLQDCGLQPNSLLHILESCARLDVVTKLGNLESLVSSLGATALQVPAPPPVYNPAFILSTMCASGAALAYLVGWPSSPHRPDLTFGIYLGPLLAPVRTSTTSTPKCVQ